MTNMPPKSEPGLATAADKANQVWGDFIPVIGFVLSYNILRRVDIGSPLFTKDTAIFWATGVLIALTLGYIGLKLFRREKISPMLLISAGVVGGFGLIGIILQEKAFIYVKPTIQQLFMAGLIFVPLLFGRNVWKSLFSNVFDMPDFAWRTLAIRWGLFFIAMAAWNEFLWRTYAPGFDTPLVIAGIPVAPAGSYEFLGHVFGAKNAEDVWANWKIGNFFIVLAFGALNTPYMLKHLRAEPAAPSA
jgi:intracellular septation protein